MKNLLFAAFALFLIGSLASCTKCKNCTATVTTTTTFPGLDPQTAEASSTAEYCDDALKEIDGETVTTETESGGATIKSVTVYECE